MNILVTGANGQLGNEMRIVSKGSSDRYIFADVTEVSEEQAQMLKRLAGEGVSLDVRKLDICDLEAVRKMVAEENVGAVINCAAYTNVDAAEDNPELAERLNALAPENLAIAMKEVGGVLVHISTDYVFGAEPYNTPCCEDRKGTPTGVYGLSKLHGEQNIIASGCQYLIVRTAWLYSEFGKNFLKTMLALTASKPQLKVVFDQVGTPTYALNLAKAIYDIVSERKFVGNYGIYHYSDEGVCSWYDFTKMIAEYSGQLACDVQPCHSDEFPSKVIRPSYSVLDKSLIKKVFGVKVPYWTEGVKRCVDVLC